MKAKDPKTMTLDEIWSECIRMWRWIVKMIKAGDERPVVILKREWIILNGYMGAVRLNCFFCHFVFQGPKSPKTKYIDGLDCENYWRNCPAKRISKSFYCTRLDYAYEEYPKAFLAELLRLNKIRTSSRGHKK